MKFSIKEAITLPMRVKSLEAEIIELKKSRDNWKNAWLEAREKTGTNYWQGYVAGKQVVIDWHINLGRKLIGRMSRFHKHSADKIKDLGYINK